MIGWRQFESVVGCFLECVLCVLLLAVMYVMMTDVKVVVTPLYRQLSCTVSAVLTVQYSLLRLVLDSSVCVAHRVGLVSYKISYMIRALLVVPHLSVLTTCSDDRKPDVILKGLDESYTRIM